MSFSGDVVDGLLTEEEHGFHEGASMHKIGETYYLAFSDASRGRPTALGYATSENPLGPFRYRGVIVDNADCDPGSWNNHGSIECYGGRWYVFYHRSSRGGRLHRRLCVEPLQVLEDGSIPEVPMTSQGAGEPFGAGEHVDAFRACGLSGAIRIDVDGEGRERLTGIADGDEAVFRYVSAGFSSLTIDAEGDGEIEVLLGDRQLCRVQAHGTRRSYRSEFPSCTAELEELRLRVRRPRELAVWGWQLGEA